jgi:hypothetical protein
MRLITIIVGRTAIVLIEVIRSIDEMLAKAAQTSD